MFFAGNLGGKMHAGPLSGLEKRPTHLLGKNSM